MVLTEHLPPYQIDTRNGVSGFATDVVRRTFENVGIPYQIEVQDWSRAYQRTLRQADTCIYSISKSTERTPLFQWVGALAYTVTSMYSRNVVMSASKPPFRRLAGRRAVRSSSVAQCNDTANRTCGTVGSWYNF